MWNSPSFAYCTRGAITATVCSSVHLALAPFPERGPQLELLQLPRRGTRQLVAELDRCRALEVREPVAAMIDQVGLGGRCAGREHDERLHGLTPLLVGHTDHRHF